MSDHSRIRSDLSHTWHAFYARFGRLRRVQLRAVDPILAGHNTLVGAATASGKTEAVVAPLVERFLDAHPAEARGLRILLIAPTRALCNDLHRRLLPPLRACRIDVAIRTSDHRTEIDDEAPPIVITTPESFDSLLARRPAHLRDIEAIVLDELHLLDGTARGDQLRCLLSRHRRIARQAPQLCAASATIADADDIARRFLGDDPHLVIIDDDERVIDAAIEIAPDPEIAAAVIDELFGVDGARKILVFTNARAQVEQLVAHLREKPTLAGRVFAHHGSLSRSVRLRTEKQFLDSPSGICVATMTLELGIDIGDIDRAILVGAPPNVGSLLQRAGRSNRRGQVARLTCLATGDFENHRFEHLLSCAGEGRLFPDPLPFRPTVIAQQALSLLFQNPSNWVDASAIHRRLPDSVAARWHEADVESILVEMAVNDYLHPMQHKRFAPGDRARKVYRYGLMHANFADTPELEVYDESTGELLGRVALNYSQQDRLEQGESLGIALGGRRREIVRQDDDQIFVESVDGQAHSAFLARQPPRYSRTLARHLAAHLGYEPREIRFHQRHDQSWLLGHFLGTRWSLLLEFVLRKQNLLKRSANAFFAPLKRPPSDEDPLSDSGLILEHARSLIAEDTRRLSRQLGAGPFLDEVPLPLMRDWLDDALQPEEFATFLARCQWIESPLHR